MEQYAMSTGTMKMPRSSALNLDSHVMVLEKCNAFLASEHEQFNYLCIQNILKSSHIQTTMWDHLARK